MLHNLKTLLKAPVQKSMQNKNRRLHVEPFVFQMFFSCQEAQMNQQLQTQMPGQASVKPWIVRG